MKQTSIWKYVSVGTCLRFLQDERAGTVASSEEGRALENIGSFLERLDDLGLHVTRRASEELVEIHKELKKKPKNYKLTVEDAEKINTIASEVRKTFEAETSGVFTYVVTDKRIDVKKLLDKVDGLFSPNVFDACDEIARSDFSEAGKCIAFERPTAAAFHILRGTESVVRMYYRCYIRPAQTGLTWGQMTHALVSKSSGKRPDSIILNNLDHIRVSFRNPTQHPDKIYDVQEVQDLFSLCVDAVNRMIKTTAKK
jgi:hypothetical protein